MERLPSMESEKLPQPYHCVPCDVDGQGLACWACDSEDVVFKPLFNGKYWESCGFHPIQGYVDVPDFL